MMLLVTALYVGNNACAPCHAKIFEQYSATPMARTSGRVSGNLPAGAFRHAASGVEYRIDPRGEVTVSTGSRLIRRALDYFIGSGAAGQSFVYAKDGFIFEAPVTWYARQQRWDVSPGYEQDRVSRWNRAVEPDCWNCHASQIRFAEGYQNRYADPPFAQSGVGCERCHGPGSEHVAGRGAMTNPAKLDPARRDSVCAQCHMSGEARVDRAGKRWRDYRPGELLSDYAAYFVHDRASALKATSYVEKLAASQCKIAAGDRLWCGTCHDPHRVPAAGERVGWYRAKCLGCHDTTQCTRGEDCAACHMPKGRVVDGGHGVLTDHAISRRPTNEPAPATWRLTAFSSAGAGARELGLAYAEVSMRTGDSRQVDEAIRILSRVPADSEVELRLALLYQKQGATARVQPLFESALRKNPNSLPALVNLGNYYAASGRLEEALALWRKALDRNPCLSEAAQNILIATGKIAQADSCIVH